MPRETEPQAARETPEGERPCTHPFDRLYRRNGHIICDACGHFDPRMDAEHVAARETLRPDPLITDAAEAMAERFEHGAAKFGRYSWRNHPYYDEDNLERLRRAVDHLEAARKNSDDPAEWRKRAADVANQAFMYADPERARRPKPWSSR